MRPYTGPVPSLRPKVAVAEAVRINPAAIITVIHDPQHFLGKRFDLNPDGSIAKSAHVSLSFGLATMHHVPTPDDLSRLLVQVGDDPSAAIINAAFEGIGIGEEFVILSEQEIENRFGIPRSDRERQKGIHRLQHEGKSLKAVGRFKENVRPSMWQLLDRDIDSHTPTQFADLSTDDWLTALGKILPGIDRVTTVRTASTSARVVKDGTPVGHGNAHVWIQFQNPEDVERLHAIAIVLAAQAQMTWTKPRHSRKEPHQVVGRSLVTLLDTSVWTPGRLIFVGKPTVCGNLTVEALSPVIEPREHASFDASAIALPDTETIRELTRTAGVEMMVSTSGASLVVAINDLTLDTIVETEKQGAVSVRQLLESGTKEKVRCQTPFRESSSFAAFYSLNADGNPFIHDVGTGISHRLDKKEQKSLDLIKANLVVKELMPAVAADPMAILEARGISSLATIKANKPADYARQRAVLKQANHQVSLSAVDMAVKAHTKELHTAQTHHGYAESLLAELTRGAWRPVAYHGSLFVLNPSTNLWEELDTDRLIRQVASSHDGKPNCVRQSDYKAIAEHAISLAGDNDFFEQAPVGIACPNTFYQIVGSTVQIDPLAPEHRQRVMLAYAPAAQDTPRFNAFLHETFASPNAGEEEDQIRLIQEIFGATLLGLMPRHHKAALYYDPFGRAGKGTLMTIQTKLVPERFVTAVSPFNWGKDYFVASLVGARLNVVGELPDSDAIPSAMFKTVIGGDLITGRHPTQRPITFKNEAAHIFMSNHLINTRDHSEAFYARWLIVEFPNSRLRSGLPLKTDLADGIIAAEMPGIAHWALQGAIRLMDRGCFSSSCVHDRLMAKWRRSSNSLEEFIAEECELLRDGTYRRSDLYTCYAEWCSENGRRPFSKSRVKELLEHNIGLGIRLVELNGYETFRGLQPKGRQHLRSTQGTSTNPPRPQQQADSPPSDSVSIDSPPEEIF